MLVRVCATMLCLLLLALFLPLACLLHTSADTAFRLLLFLLLPLLLLVLVLAGLVAKDVPGLLEGAHEGHGLGHAFLRHISRCRVLLHLLDGTSPDPIGDYKAIQLELELFNPALLEKPQVR